jgi:hypothetical protein
MDHARRLGATAHGIPCELAKVEAEHATLRRELAPAYAELDRLRALRAK